ncbi:unnamed protein product [Leptidea sinapis]|uniref:Uncharacterized protein n=1 Tax=Leptidea sinapis TaxID=189913 RepID=A0A5E4R242_9NEOP|nr:unnamed protein product [Leptidea sinapis]
MSKDRTFSGSGPAPNNRLCATIIFFVGVICIFGGFLLGRMSRKEVRRSNDVVPINLTIAADNLYKKARRMPPKVIHHADPEKITLKILEIFQCNATDCGGITGYNIADFVKTCINYEVNKFIRTLNNATLYIDSLR